MVLAGALIVGIYESRKLTAAAAALDAASKGRIGEITGSGDMEGKAGNTLLLHNVPGTLCDRILLVGLGKSLVFAFIIATVGCFQGLRTSGSADSVGRQTTLSVVQSIFTIIVADALFSVAFNMLGL